MDLDTVLTELGTQLSTITGLRVYDYPPEDVAVPAVIVAYPSELTFDETYGRGMDRLSVPVIVVVGKVSERSTRKALVAYCDGSGASSIKAVLESGTYTSFDDLRVESASFGEMTFGNVSYMAANFTVDIAGQGA